MVEPRTIEEAQAQIKSLQNQMKDLRRIERNIRVREQALSSEPMVNNKDLRSSLCEFLPDHLMPRNVGSYNSVSWPFFFQVNFDFGLNPAITSYLSQSHSFQVTQEGALLLLQISRTSDEYTTAGDLGPWTVEFRDRQSSRQFNDRPIPLQMIGTKARPSDLPTPMLLMPNAFFDVKMSSWLPAGLTQNTLGVGRHQISFHGLRVRVEDYDKVLSSIFV